MLHTHTHPQPVNELGPVFVETLYETIVAEDLAVGQDIGVMVVATDGEQHNVTYSIDSSFQDGSFFSVSSSTGVISLARSLDRDPPASHLMFTFAVRQSLTLHRY